MNLPGLITVQPDRTEELDALARMVGTCFLEEMWYVTWLEALDELGIERAVEMALEGRDLAAIGLGAGALRAGIGIGDVLGDDAHASGLAAQTGSGDGDALDQIHDQ